MEKKDKQEYKAGREYIITLEDQNPFDGSHPIKSVTELVRCKDCKYRDEEITIPAPDESPYESFTFAKCPCRSFNLSDDFFCGKGKRKDGDSDG